MAPSSRPMPAGCAPSTGTAPRSGTRRSTRSRASTRPSPKTWCWWEGRDAWSRSAAATARSDGNSRWTARCTPLPWPGRTRSWATRAAPCAVRRRRRRVALGGPPRGRPVVVAAGRPVGVGRGRGLGTTRHPPPAASISRPVRRGWEQTLLVHSAGPAMDDGRAVPGHRRWPLPRLGRRLRRRRRCAALGRSGCRHRSRPVSCPRSMRTISW